MSQGNHKRKARAIGPHGCGHGGAKNALTNGRAVPGNCWTTFGAIRLSGTGTHGAGSRPYGRGTWLGRGVGGLYNQNVICVMMPWIQNGSDDGGNEPSSWRCARRTTTSTPTTTSSRLWSFAGLVCFVFFLTLIAKPQNRSTYFVFFDVNSETPESQKVFCFFWR